MTRLSDLLATEGIDQVDLLKIDVQKAEHEVLDGIDDRDWPRIAQIVAEVHDQDGRLERMTSLLEGHGFVVATDQDIMFAGTDMRYVYARRPGYEAQRGMEPMATPMATPPQPVAAEQLMTFLSERLPDHHLPAILLIFSEFPRTASGKPDRPRIIDTVRAHAEHLPLPADVADDPFVASIAEVWSDVLGRPAAAGDDFFGIGGNSLTAARVIIRLRDRLNCDVPVRLLFATSELTAFASELRLRTQPPPAAPSAPSTDSRGEAAAAELVPPTGREDTR